MKAPLIISACLLGHNVKYNGGNNKNEDVKELEEYFEFIPICPETEGGLSTPRDPSEIVGNKVLSNKGVDVTKYFYDGAKIALERAIKCGAKYAILKARSPSCGKDFIYDGTFTGTLVRGDGVTAKMLRENGIKIFKEDEIDRLLTIIKKDLI